MSLKHNGTTLPSQLPQRNNDKEVIIEEIITQASGEPQVVKYRRGRLLGKGGFATCYEITNLETKRVSAAKVIAKSSLTTAKAKERLSAQIKVHRALHHPNIVELEHVFEDKDNVYIVQELCSNQSLKELLTKRQRLTESETQEYMLQIVGALKYLQSNRVVHRDIQLSNLLLSGTMQLKISGFSLAVMLDNDKQKKTTICGAANYITPEVLEGTGHSYEVDVWALGVVIYTLLIGKTPFETSDTKTTFEKVRRSDYSFPASVPLSRSVKDLISRIFVLDPSKRPTLDEILTHPFVTETLAQKEKATAEASSSHDGKENKDPTREHRKNLRDRFLSFQDHTLLRPKRQEGEDRNIFEFKSKLSEVLRSDDIVFQAPTMYLLKNQTSSFIAAQLGLYSENADCKGAIKVTFTAYVDSEKYGKSVFQVPCKSLMEPNFEISCLVIGSLIQEGHKVHARLDLEYCFDDVMVSSLYSSGNVRIRY